MLVRGARWPGDVLVVDGRIAAIGSPAPPRGATVLAAGGALVTRALVNAHHHLFQRVTRGRATGCGLVDWLGALLPEWARLDPADMVLAARLSLAELALGGVGTTVDHHFVVPGGDPAVLRAIAADAVAMGLRLVLARGVLDHGEDAGGIVPRTLVEDPDDAMASIDVLAADLARRHGPGGARPGDVAVAVAPSSLFAVSRPLLRAAAALASGRALRLHAHLSESAAEEAACQARFGLRPVDLLDDCGWVGPATWVAHGIHLPAADRVRLASAGVGVAHCPASNARLGSGICPVTAWRAAGAPVGIGVDGAAANDAGDPLLQLRLAVYLARLRAGRADALTAAEALAMATVEGARCLGRADLAGAPSPPGAPADLRAGDPGTPRGTDPADLRVGDPADLAVWPMDDLADIPDPVDALVLGPGRPVRHLLVAGRPVVVDGVLPGIDLPALRAAVTRAGAPRR